MLDRLVGYQISPLLWDKVRRGLSAGRVQTVALRLIVEREREIGAFQPLEYWTLEAQLHPEKQSDQKFKAKFIGIGGEPVRVANGKDKEGKELFIASALPDKKTMDGVLAALEEGRLVGRRRAVARTAAPAAGALHHQPTAARRGQQTWLQRAEDHGRGAAAV